MGKPFLIPGMTRLGPKHVGIWLEYKKFAIYDPRGYGEWGKR